MSFARGLALAAMAVSAMGGQYAAGTDLIRNTFGPDPEVPRLPRISYGRGHWGGHKGQFAKRVERSRMRNAMRRTTHQQQRRAHPKRGPRSVWGDRSRLSDYPIRTYIGYID